MSLKLATAIAALIVLVGGGITVWVFVQPRATTAGPLVTPASDAERAKLREKFFGGDPDRDVRGGKEMKPRW